MAAESIRAKTIEEAESIRPSVIIEDDSIRIIVDLKAGSIHPNDITETESTILAAIMETELFQGMLCFMRRRHGRIPVSTYVWGLYESSCRVAVNSLSRCYFWNRNGGIWHATVRALQTKSHPSLT